MRVCREGGVRGGECVCVCAFVCVCLCVRRVVGVGRSLCINFIANY